MTNYKGLLAMAGFIVVASVIEQILGFDFNSVSYGFAVGVVAEIIYANTK